MRGQERLTTIRGVLFSVVIVVVAVIYVVQRLLH